VFVSFLDSFVPVNTNSGGYAAVVPPPLPVYVPPAPISVSGGPPIFNRSQSLPPQKTAISQLQECCQQNKLKDPDYRELQSSGGFRFTVTVNGKSYNGELKARKQDARQSAAEAAMRRVGSITSNLSFIYAYIINVSMMVGVHDRGLPATASSSDSYKKVLKEQHFDKNHIEFKKEYFITHKVVGGYQCTLTIPGMPTLHGETGPSKSAAEHNFAKSALKFLKLL